MRDLGNPAKARNTEACRTLVALYESTPERDRARFSSTEKTLILNALVFLKDMAKLRTVFHAMPDRDKYQYSVFLNACKYQGLFGPSDDGTAVFEEMRAAGVESKIGANTVTYSTVITGLCGGQRLDAALDLFQEMRASPTESNIPVNGMTLVVLTRFLFQANRGPDLEAIVGQMTQSSVTQFSCMAFCFFVFLLVRCLDSICLFVKPCAVCLIDVLCCVLRWS